MAKTEKEIHLVIKATVDEALKGFRKVRTETGSTTSALTNMAKKIIVPAAAYLSISKVTDTLVKMSAAARVQEQAEKKVEAVLRATGYAAGVSAEQVKKLASEIQSYSNFGDEVLLEPFAKLATYSDITEENFTRAGKVVADYAALFGSLDAAVESVGKALENPIDGFESLQKQGYKLTNTQKDYIATLIETGQKAEAQREILTMLESSVGGVAAATADAATQLKNTFGDALEIIGTKINNSLMPAMGTLTKKLQEFIDMSKKQGAFKPLNVKPELEQFNFAEKERELAKFTKTLDYETKQYNEYTSRMGTRASAYLVSVFEKNISKHQSNIDRIKTEIADMENAYKEMRKNETPTTPKSPKPVQSRPPVKTARELSIKEWQVQLTHSSLDDIQLELDKALKAAWDQSEDYYAKVAETIKQVYAKKMAEAIYEEKILIQDLADYEAQLRAEASNDAIAFVNIKFNREHENLKRYKDAGLDVTNAITAIEKQRQKELQDAKLSMWDKLKNKSNDYFDALKARIVEMYESMSELDKAKTQVSVAGIDATKDTEAGQIVGTLASGGGLAGIVGLVATSFFELAMSIDSVAAVMNPIQTVMEGVFAVIGPILNEILAPLADILTVIGEVLGAIFVPILEVLGALLAPIIEILTPIVKILQQLAPMFEILFSIMNPIMPVIQMLGAALKVLADIIIWLYNNVLRPVGNLIIDTYNAFARAINSALGWLGIKIKEINRLDKIDNSALQTQADKIAKDLEIVNQAIEDVKQRYQEQRALVRDLFTNNIQSLQDLKRVGAMTRAEYEKQVAYAQKEYNDKIAALNAQEKAQLTALENIKALLEKGIVVYDMVSATQGKPKIDFWGSIFSDERLKTNISSVGSTVGGLPLYKYQYSNFAQDKFGMPANDQVGVMAQEVKKVMPEAITTKDGYMMVDYEKLAKYRGQPNSTRTVPSDMRLKTNIRPAAGGNGKVYRTNTVSGISPQDAPIIVNVNVSGSIVSEKDLTDKLTIALQKNLSRGYAPQGMRA